MAQVMENIRRRVRRGLGLAAIMFALLPLPGPAFAASHGPTSVFKGEMSKFVLFKEPWPAPSTPFLDGDENTTDLSRFRGKVVLLNFWATWCYPCLLEMPSLDALQAALGGRNFVVVALSIDRGGMADVKRFFRKQKLATLDHYVDPVGKVGPGFRLRGVPASFIIDHDGLVRAFLPGPADWNSSDARAVIRHYIARIAGDKTNSNTTGGKK
jgi:thiol-disulfide isomerase/thioredoxin